MNAWEKQNRITEEHNFMGNKFHQSQNYYKLVYTELGLLWLEEFDHFLSLGYRVEFMGC